MAEYSNDDLINMREQAVAAGDDKSVQIINQAISQQQTEPQRLRSVAQGATFGFSDEMEGGLMSVIKGTPYKQERDAVRGKLDAYRLSDPWASMGYEVAGGLVSGGIGGAKALGTSTIRNLPRWRQLMTVGAGEGAIAGAGVAPELSDIPAASTVGGVIGAGGGAIGNVLENLLMRTASTQVGREVAQALRRGDMTPDDAIQALQDLGPEGMLADVSPHLMGKARKVAAEVGPGRAIVQESLDQRQLGQIDRITQGVGAEDFSQYLDDLDVARRTQATPYYDDAYAGRIDPTRNMKMARDTKAGKKAWGEARDRYMNRNLLSEADMADVDLDIQPQMWDLWGRRMQGLRGVAKRSGDNDASGYLKDIKSLADEDIYKQVPALQEARRIASGPLKAQEAADQGRKLFSGKSDVTARTVRDMSDQEREAFLRGATQAIVDKLEGSVETANAARNLIKTTKVRKLLREAFDTSDAYDEFINLLERESQMGETFAQINRGSRTAMVEGEKADLGPAMELLPNVMQGDASGILRSLGRTVTGIGSNQYPEQVSRQLGGLLTQQGPAAEAGLMQALQASQANPYVMGGLMAVPSQQATQSLWGPRK